MKEEMKRGLSDAFLKFKAIASKVKRVKRREVFELDFTIVHLFNLEGLQVREVGNEVAAVFSVV